jgi:hypothetical protein
MMNMRKKVMTNMETITMTRMNIMMMSIKTKNTTMIMKTSITTRMNIMTNTKKKVTTNTIIARIHMYGLGKIILSKSLNRYVTNLRKSSLNKEHTLQAILTYLSQNLKKFIAILKRK